MLREQAGSNSPFCSAAIVRMAEAGLSMWYDIEVPLRVCCGSAIAVNLPQALDHVGEAAQLLERVADLVLFITLVELASGFLLCWDRDKSAALRKRLRYITFAFTLIIFILVVVAAALKTSAYVTFYSTSRAAKSPNEDFFWYSSGLGAVADKLEKLWVVDKAIHIIFWLTSFPVLVYISYAAHTIRANRILRKVRVPPCYVLLEFCFAHIHCTVHLASLGCHHS